MKNNKIFCFVFLKLIRRFYDILIIVKLSLKSYSTVKLISFPTGTIPTQAFDIILKWKFSFTHRKNWIQSAPSVESFCCFFFFFLFKIAYYLHFVSNANATVGSLTLSISWLFSFALDLKWNDDTWRRLDSRHISPIAIRIITA